MNTTQLIYAAESNDPKAQVELADLYILGRGVPKDRSLGDR